MKRMRLALFVMLCAAPAQAQNATPAAASGAKRVLTVDDYSKWRTINGAQLSGDGKWVAYGFAFTNVPTADTKPELHLRNLQSGQEITIADASAASFSADSRWVTYQVDPPAPRGGRGGRGGGAGAPAADTTAPAGRGAAAATPAPQRHLELRELATGRVQSWLEVQSATFSPTASHLLIRRRPASAAPAAGGAAPGGRGGGGGGSADGRGTDALLHDLVTGRSLFLGSVDDAAFNRQGDLLAYTVGASVKDGNGLFAIDLTNGMTHVLDNDAQMYSRMTFSDDGNGIAVLKSKDVPKMREHETVLLAYPDLRAAFNAGPEPVPVLFDPSKAEGFPKGFMLSDRAAINWSDDKQRIFFGMIPQTAAPDTSRRKSADSVADVDVWGAQDERVQSYQMARADGDRNYSFREALVLPTGKFVRLADSTMKELEVSADGKWAVGRDIRGYISDYVPARADLYRVNTTTGERTLILKSALVGQHVVGITPNGKHFLFWKDAKYQDYDLDAGTTKALGDAKTPSFKDTEFDHPGTMPPFGVVGYPKDGNGVLVEHRYDIWLLPFDGSAPRAVTLGVGAKQEIKFMPVRPEPIDPMLPREEREPRVYDLSKPLMLSAYGEWTKKAGFYRLENGQMIPVIYEDAAFSNPQKAAKGDRWLYTRQTFVEFPDLRISSAALTDAIQITHANPQQGDYIWGHRLLFDYKIKDGTRLQGILAIPDTYKPGTKLPMIVSFYEKNSQNMHRYVAPSYLTGMGSLPIEAVSRGYLTMFADIHYHTGQSHSDQLEGVEAATKKVIEMGYADPKHIGLNGHSYGGEGAGFIATRSRMFAAVGVGAGVSDLYTDFNQSWGWSYQNTSGASGQNGLDYYIYGQGRWGFSPWDKPEVYHFESSLTHAPEATAAILIMHGTADPTVSFNEGLKFYTALRYNKKDATLLAYQNEPHGLRGLANRKDLTIRYFQFFDHYLMGKPAPKWLTDGVPFLVKDEVKSPS